MTDKNEVIHNVKNWITIDNEIKELQKIMREKRKEKKIYTESLVNIMKENEIDCFDCNSGKIAYTKNKVRKGISRKFLFETLGKYFGSEEEALKASEYIMENREVEIKETVKLRKKKNMFDK